MNSLLGGGDFPHMCGEMIGRLFRYERHVVNMRFRMLDVYPRGFGGHLLVLRIRGRRRGDELGGEEGEEDGGDEGGGGWELHFRLVRER